MNSKKLLAVTAMTGCLATMLTGLTGCKRGVEVGGEAVIQVRALNGGYGIDFLNELIKKYEVAFPEHKVVIEEASISVAEKANQEIQSPKTNQIDLYLLNGGALSTFIGKSQNILKSKTKTLLEDLRDIFDSPAIGFDGKEETETIGSRMFDGYEEACTYNGMVERWQGGMFKLPWADAATGLFANKPVLDKYGIDIPLTSNELTAAIEKIYNDPNAQKDGVHPYSWGGTNIAGYWSYLFEAWFAQYSGHEQFIKFMRCEPDEGTIQENGYEVYDDQGILEGLKAMDDILNLKYAKAGSASMDHMTVQGDFVRGESAFMIDGEWLLAEMRHDYFEQAKNVVMVPTPILSVIGTECGLTDAQLHDVVKGIDDGKADAQIRQDVPACTEQSLARIRDARSIHNAIGTGHNIFIPSYADAKDAAKNFVRFMFSNDACRNFRNLAYGTMPVTYVKEDTDSNTPFQQSVDKMLSVGHPKMVSGDAEYNDVRKASLMCNFNVTEWAHPNTYKAMMTDKYYSEVRAGYVRELTPEKIFNGEKEYMRDNWESYMNYVF